MSILRQKKYIFHLTTQSMAAGLTIRADDFELFKHAFEAVVRSLITEADLESVLEVDGGLASQDMTFQTAQLLESQVWGQGFAPPLFFDEFEVVSQRVLSEKHLKLTLKPVSNLVASNRDGMEIDAVYFNQTDLPGDRIHAAYQLQTNSYNGAQKVQLNLRFVSA